MKGIVRFDGIDQNIIIHRYTVLPGKGFQEGMQLFHEPVQGIITYTVRHIQYIIECRFCQILKVVIETPQVITSCGTHSPLKEIVTAIHKVFQNTP